MLFDFSFRDPGPVGNGRYSERMLPEVEIKDFRKGAQVNFRMKGLFELIYLCTKFASFAVVLNETATCYYGYGGSPVLLDISGSL